MQVPFTLPTSPSPNVLQRLPGTQNFDYCSPPFIIFVPSGIPLISPCFLDTALAGILLTIVLFLVSSALISYKSRSTESVPLLPQTPTQYRLYAKYLSFFVLLTVVVELAVDLQEILKKDTSAIFEEPARLVSDLLVCFVWIWIVTAVTVIKDEVDSAVSTSIFLATCIYTVQFGQWCLLWYYSSTGVLPEFAFSDLLHLFGFLIRFAAVISLLLIARNYNAFHRRGLQSVDIETQTLTSSSSWVTSIIRVQKLFPYIWPNTTYLRFLVICCMILLVLGRIINVMVPLQYKVVVNDLAAASSLDSFLSTLEKNLAWGAIILFVFLRFLQGSVGLVSTFNSLLWIPVAQYTAREVSVEMLRHLHSLSLQFHLTRKTGEVLRVMDRGTSSIGSLLSYLLFNIIPVIVDIVVAVVLFLVKFDAWLSVIVLVTMVLYIVVTIIITEWRTSFRKEMIDLDNKTRTRSVDSLLNFETVKYYNAEKWEVEQYETAIRMYQKADWKSTASLNFLNTAQNAIITLGLLAGSLLCAKRVLEKDLSVGDFVFFLTYLTQLYGPLNWLGTYYRVIQQNFIDMEQMLDLFKVSKGVDDKPDAKPLEIREGGTVVFENVGFSYDSRRTTLEDISFSVPKGKTVALVGDSGSGKSTVFRLLFRFYDSTKGRILVDGQDIRDVTQDSLRRTIGVVPQDTVLFNNDIRYNIRYGNVNASDEMVEDAAKAAQIHDRIMEFPDKYETKVGERGLRLSGGEKQRVAIARTILKSPMILLLDEATSALDTTTERKLQGTLKELAANRTTLVIAHRLSTIIDADEILVMKSGKIVERGTHESLLRILDGEYLKMWEKQQFESKNIPLPETSGPENSK